MLALAFAEIAGAVTKFRAYADLDEVPAPVAAGCDILILPGQLSFPEARFALWPRLRALISPFTGIEGFDVAAASARAILVANGQSRENSDSLAEATILLILASLYDLDAIRAVLREGRPRPSPMPGQMLAGKRLGLIGFGAVARSITARLAPWGAAIAVHTRTVPQSIPPGLSFVCLDELIAQSDVIVMLAGFNAANHHMLDAARLAQMKPDVLLVNVARGGLIDEAALAEILVARPRMRAALDVFEVEPLPADSPLRRLPNAILTPHMLGHTRDSVASLPPLLVANVRAIVVGEAPPCLCNPEALGGWRDRRAGPA